MATRRNPFDPFNVVDDYDYDYPGGYGNYYNNPYMGGGINPNPTGGVQPRQPDGNSTNRSTNVGPWAAGYGPQPDNVVVPETTPGPSGGATDWSKFNFSGNPNAVRDYFASRGVAPRDTSPDYWASKWEGLVRRGQEIGNPNYAFQRLEAADEFLPNQDPRNSPFAGSAPGGGMFAPSEFSGEGQSPLTGPINEGILSILKQGWGPDKNQLAKRYESARETIDRGRRSQMNNLSATLAERGLLGSGPEKTGLENIEANLAGQYSTALRDATLAEDEIASGRYMQALDAGLGSMAQDTNAKKVMGELALGHLAQNRMWNQFLAQYGLDREKVMSDIQMGNIDRYTELIRLFFQYGAGLSQGEAEA